MTYSTSKANNQTPASCSILDLTANDARKFLLKDESYCNLDLPPYFTFGDLLTDVDQLLDNRMLSSCRSQSPRAFDDVNYPVVHNKDGTYAWRPLQLIHPALYVSLVHQIAEPSFWSEIQTRFKNFADIDFIRCMSIPRVSLTKEKDKAEQISHWWREIEQKSIELSLDFEYLFQTDITDCYGSIYTHSIPWALHTQPVAKDRRGDQTLIGNLIDDHIQDMSYGQTNGIPQGSVIMDFIAEMVLGYADELLASRIDIDGEECMILRYRDDYRIFGNNPQIGNEVLKQLTEILHGLGLKLNSTKTQTSNSVVSASIKKDKMAWMAQKQADHNLQKHLLIIYNHSMKFPNSGSLAVALGNYHKRLLRTRRCYQPIPLIAIVVDIAYRNPRTYPICAAILSRLFTFIEEENRKLEIIERIRKKFAKIPNTGIMEIWLQRITLSATSNIQFGEKLCHLVAGNNVQIWNNDWLSWPDLKSAIDSRRIIDPSILDKVKSEIPATEVELFVSKARRY